MIYYVLWICAVLCMARIAHAAARRRNAIEAEREAERVIWQSDPLYARELGLPRPSGWPPLVQMRVDPPTGPRPRGFGGTAQSPPVVTGCLRASFGTNVEYKA